MSFKNASSFSGIPSSIFFHIEKHRKILKIIVSASPIQIRPFIKDCVINEDRLMIYVSSAMWASQLRFCSNQIQTAVNSQSNEKIKKVRVRILSPAPFEADNTSQKIIPSEETIESLRNNAGATSEGKLKDALLSLSATLQKQNK